MVAGGGNGFSGKVALVTGGGRGLGRETCRQLGKKGFRVILTARREAAGRAAATTLADEGLDVGFRPLDVVDPNSIAALAAGIAADGVVLDVLVNNAAVALDGFDGDVARKTLAANFFGPLRVTDALAELLREAPTWSWCRAAPASCPDTVPPSAPPSLPTI